MRGNPRAVVLAFLTVTILWLSPVSADTLRPVETMGKDGAPMVLVPAGAFPMGVPAGDRDGGRDEYPRHDVMLDAYTIDKFEVTNGRYQEFSKATGHRPPQHPKDQSRTLWRGDQSPDSISDRPVINVDWYDADAYCKWAGKRLPTEAEWEKAARGTDSRRFPWGNVEPTAKHLNYNQHWIGEKTLMPVGSYEAGKSPYGAYDMAGNVWEWVTDWYDQDYYRHGPTRNPPGPESGEEKVIRGGSWDFQAQSLLVVARLSFEPTMQSGFIGFRCAQSAH